jgi:hypothetical protein
VQPPIAGAACQCHPWSTVHDRVLQGCRYVVVVPAPVSAIEKQQRTAAHWAARSHSTLWRIWSCPPVVVGATATTKSNARPFTLSAHKLVGENPFGRGSGTEPVAANGSGHPRAASPLPVARSRRRGCRATRRGSAQIVRTVEAGGCVDPIDRQRGDATPEGWTGRQLGRPSVTRQLIFPRFLLIDALL